MKKIICIILITVTSILSGCNSTSDEEIISSQDFKENYEVSSYVRHRLCGLLVPCKA